MPQYHTILFDADNTLFDFSAAERAAIGDTLRAFAIVPTEELILTYSRINDDAWKRLERGEITKEALRVTRFVDFCATVGISCDPSQMAATYLEALSQQHELMEGALEVSRTLAAHFKLYIVTNGIETVQRRRLAASGLAPYFADIFISEELGFEKPHIGYFQEVACRIKEYSPKHTLIVGDSLTSDMKGGVAAGLDTCWFDPQGSPNKEGVPVTYRIQALEDLVPLLLA